MAKIALYVNMLLRIFAYGFSLMRLMPDPCGGELPTNMLQHFYQRSSANAEKCALLRTLGSPEGCKMFMIKLPSPFQRRLSHFYGLKQVLDVFTLPLSF